MKVLKIKRKRKGGVDLDLVPDLKIKADGEVEVDQKKEKGEADHVQKKGEDVAEQDHEKEEEADQDQEVIEEGVEADQDHVTAAEEVALDLDHLKDDRLTEVKELFDEARME